MPPLYEFGCSLCGCNFERQLKIAQMDEPLGEKCPGCGVDGNIKRHVGGTHAFMSPEALGRKKAPREFRDWLSAVKKAHPGSTIKDR